MQIDDKFIMTTGKFVRTVRIKDEIDRDVGDPLSLIEKIKTNKIKADIFTFWQGIPNTEPKFDYYMEYDNMAVLPVKDFKHWWEKQIDSKNRNVIRKAEKKGVVVKVVDFNDDLVQGIMDIYNETPVRQGKPFWHYGKDFETVKRGNGTHLERSDFIGAFYNNKLIGFIKLVYSDSGEVARTEQILSRIEHRDKSPTNALIAKVVEICENKKVSNILYAYWPKGSLADFKKHNGFEEMPIPRYYVPISIIGKIALKLKLHHGVKGFLPENIISRLIELRTKWYSRKFKNA